jgi:hypothetical protein
MVEVEHRRFDLLSEHRAQPHNHRAGAVIALTMSARIPQACRCVAGSAPESAVPPAHCSDRGQRLVTMASEPTARRAGPPATGEPVHRAGGRGLFEASALGHIHHRRQNERPFSVCNGDSMTPPETRRHSAPPDLTRPALSMRGPVAHSRAGRQPPMKTLGNQQFDWLADQFRGVPKHRLRCWFARKSGPIVNHRCTGHRSTTARKRSLARNCVASWAAAIMPSRVHSPWRMMTRLGMTIVGA